MLKANNLIRSWLQISLALFSQIFVTFGFVMQNSVDMNDDDDEYDKDSIATPPSGVIRLNVSKAGMEGLDLDRINKIINDTSRGSKFYEHKKKNQEQLRKKVADMQAQVAAFSAETLAKAEKQVGVVHKFYFFCWLDNDDYDDILVILGRRTRKTIGGQERFVTNYCTPGHGCVLCFGGNAR